MRQPKDLWNGWLVHVSFFRVAFRRLGVAFCFTRLC